MLILAALWLTGFLLAIVLARRASGKLSVLDFACCALVATLWPLLAAAVLGYAVLFGLDAAQAEDETFIY
jgi:hypothetical protein